MNDTQEIDEFAVLGTVMDGSSESVEAAEIVRQSGGLLLFNSEWACEVWRRAEAALNAKRPPVAFLNTKQVEPVPQETLEQIFKSGVTLSILEQIYLPALKKSSKERVMRRAMKEAVDGGDIQRALDLCRQADQVEPKERSKEETAKEIIDKWQWASEHPGQLPGIPTGLMDLNKITGGWQDESLIIIGARPSQGKTALLLGFARAAAIENGIPTLFITLESSVVELTRRLACQIARANQTRLRDGDACERDIKSLSLAFAKIKDNPIWWADCSGMSINTIQSMSARISKSYGIKLIIVDYLQKIKPAVKNEKKTYEVAQASEGLKMIAKELNVPVISAAQLNREPEKNKGRSPALSDLRDSGQIECDADIVGLIERRVLENGDAEYALLISKFRDGPVGRVNMVFLPECGRFEDASKISHEDYQSTHPDP